MSDLPSSKGKTMNLHGFVFTDLNFKDIVVPYIEEFEVFLDKLENPYFKGPDAAIYYSMIRKYMPNKIIEIGSGFCTKIAMDAINKNDKGSIVSIDPHPRTDLPSQVDRIVSNVQDVDISVFKSLKPGDFLFIDSSHSSEEAEYNTENILSILSTGVIIHFHDITYPYETSPEADVLLPYLLKNKYKFKIILSAAYIRYSNIKLLTDYIPFINGTCTGCPGSIWLEKT